MFRCLSYNRYRKGMSGSAVKLRHCPATVKRTPQKIEVKPA
jgi:hypothetical protein